ncbi:UNVERIFIED_CONTAM: hypothetical protein O8I53_06075 [Campylobacter lari]
MPPIIMATSCKKTAETAEESALHMRFDITKVNNNYSIFHSDFGSIFEVEIKNISINQEGNIVITFRVKDTRNNTYSKYYNSDANLGSNILKSEIDSTIKHD